MTGRTKAFAALLLLALAVPAARPAQGAAQGMLPHRAYLPLVARAPDAPSLGYGIQVHAIDAIDADYTIGLAKDLGMGWVKQQIRWEHVERSPGSYQWGDPDRVADAAGQAGLKLLFSIVAAPDWARPGKEGSGPPDDPADFARFMSAMATRYRGRVQAYEIWNEQNLQREWDGVSLSAADYVALLAAAYPAIVAADPEAVVISGAMAPTGINDGIGAIDDRVYLQAMYEAGLSAVCDAVGSHPYGFANPPDVYFQGPYGPPGYDPNRGWDEYPCFFFRNTLQDYYAIMVANGDGGKRVWATEFGWPTIDGMGVSTNPGYEYAADITEAQQADYIAGAYRWAAGWGHAGTLVLWNLNMWPIVGPENEMSKFSILRGDWSPRPAYVAIRALSK
jgi:hypothetical protein